MINVMRNIFILMIMCLLPICGMQAQDSLASDGSINQQANEVSKLSTLPSDNLNYSDSLFESKIDSLAVECNNIQEAQEVEGYLLIGVGGFSLILLVLIVILWTKLNTVSSKRKAMRDEFEEFKKHPLTQGHLNYLRSLFMADVDNRIAKNNQISGIEQQVEDSPSSLKVEPIVDNVPITRYFATNSGSYFVKAFSEKNPTTAFKVTFSNSSMSEGEFELIDLNKIKSSDSIKQVVDFVSESKKIELAKEAILKERGKVVKNGNSWKVVSKLKLKLY